MINLKIKYLKRYFENDIFYESIEVLSSTFIVNIMLVFYITFFSSLLHKNKKLKKTQNLIDTTIVSIQTKSYFYNIVGICNFFKLYLFLRRGIQQKRRYRMQGAHTGIVFSQSLNFIEKFGSNKGHHVWIGMLVNDTEWCIA